MAQFFGVRNQYTIQRIAPLRQVLHEAEIQLSSLLSRQHEDLRRADSRGAEQYQIAHAQRKEEAAAQAVRAVERKAERRIRYLERSPAIRSAARFLKQVLIRQQASANAVSCFYCRVTLSASESHLEHKRPLARGGDNRRGNLVLACGPCNLKKGRQTHEEFMRSRKKDAL
ncbi:MAG: HNH endonuclease [Burkholderiales bacterium]|nr:HNH endonuclease [Burkholderiales bacterium]